MTCLKSHYCHIAATYVRGHCGQIATIGMAIGIFVPVVYYQLAVRRKRKLSQDSDKTDEDNDNDSEDDNLDR